jgi:hypothetical protein
VRKPENALLVALIVWHLVPIWVFVYFPSQDGGEHINNANILRRYFTPSGALFREYFVLNRNPDPNWLGHAILVILMSVLPSNLAEKALLTVYVVAFPVSVRYALRAIRPDAGWVAVFSFSFVWNFLVHMGFWNYALSLPLFFFVVGYWTYHRSDFGLRQSVALTALSLLLYFAHPVSYTLAVAYIALLGACLTLIQGVLLVGTRQFTVRGLWKGVRHRLATPFYALSPSLGLFLAFVGRRPSDWGPPGPDLWKRLRTLDSLIAYQESEVRLTTAVVWVFVATGIALLLFKVWRRRITAWDGILAMVAVVIALYFRVPEVMAGGGSFVSHRLNLMAYLALILWFGAQTYHRVARWVVYGVVAALSVVLTAYRLPKYAELNDYLAELMSAEPYIERYSTFLPLIYSYQGLDPSGYFLSTRTGPFIHVTGRIAASRNAVELENYEANTGYFPMIWRHERNPYVHISVAPGTVSSLPPSVDFLSYPAKTKGRVDYVLLWNYRPDESEPVQAVFRQLAMGYDLIYTSPKRGYVAVYRRKDLAPKLQ